MARRRRQPSQEEREDDNSSLGLPSHVFESILARLPVKSLLRAKAVSKFWNATISNTQFTKIQSQTPSSSSTRFLIWDRNRTGTNRYGGYVLLNFQGETFHLESDLGCPFGVADILCFCNGIILLRCIFQHPEMHVLWNPCRRMHSIIWWAGDWPATHGLCYDPTTDDYKVVIITRSKLYSVFSCKKRAWTKRKFVCPNYEIIRNIGVYVEGAFYWLCSDKGDNGDTPGTYNHSELVCFDGAQDKCDKLQLPEPARGFLSDVVLATMKGCLGLIYICPMSLGIIQIWKMETHRDSNSWRPLMGFATYINMSVSIREPCPMSNDLVMIFIDRSKFILYDVNEEKPVGNIQTFPILWSWRLVPCRDQLFFPVQQNSRPRRKSSNKISYSTFASCSRLSYE